MNIVALATIVEYGADTYGMASIARLLSLINTHRGWDTLIPAVFDVSAAEFEQGWHDFLRDEYAVHME